MAAEVGCSATAFAAAPRLLKKELQGEMKISVTDELDGKEVNSLPMTGKTKEFCEYTSGVLSAEK